MVSLRARVSKKLVGFSNEFPGRQFEEQMSVGSVEKADFPVPELILFTLRNIMGWHWSGEEEKVRWTVYGSVDGEPIFFSLRKFGFKVGHKVGGKVPVSRVVGQLRAALKLVEEVLEPFAKHQIGKGEVVIANRFGEFSSRYLFFREKADKAFKKAKPKPRKRKKARRRRDFGRKLMTDFVAEMNRAIKHEKRGFVYSVAMVDCFFSALEHRLVLLRAFTGRPMADGELAELLQSKWEEKLKSVIQVAGDRKVELLFGELREIKERVRNPFAHGGMENDGGSLFINMPRIGSVPANFSRFGKSVRFSHLPVGHDAHAEYCRIFDGLDDILSSGALLRPHRLLDAGVDPSFDAENLKTYLATVTGSDEAVEHFIARWSHEWERHANMDY
ncbi:hypothetical protein [Rhizobium mongolense]|uniref:hypothetical protein n=1 Tax=Rhizobium mongolense TaxID=57676 RepID=UPI0034A285CB